MEWISWSQVRVVCHGVLFRHKGVSAFVACSLFFLVSILLSRIPWSQVRVVCRGVLFRHKGVSAFVFGFAVGKILSVFFDLLGEVIHRCTVIWILFLSCNKNMPNVVQVFSKNRLQLVVPWKNFKTWRKRGKQPETGRKGFPSVVLVMDGLS